jgi:hypothetical protein
MIFRRWFLRVTQYRPTPQQQQVRQRPLTSPLEHPEGNGEKRGKQQNDQNGFERRHRPASAHFPTNIAPARPSRYLPSRQGVARSAKPNSAVPAADGHG